MAQNTQTFILVGDFKDNITPKLRKLDKAFKELSRGFEKNFDRAFKDLDKNLTRFERNSAKTFRGLGKELGNITKGFDKSIDAASRGVGKLDSSLNDAARAAGKVRDTVSGIGEGLKGFDSLSESMEGVARAAGRAQNEVDGIGEAAGRANRKADDLMTTLLKAEGLSRFGDAMADGFGRSMNTVVGTAQKGVGMVGKLFKDAMDDELADIKAASGIQGSFKLAGYEGTFSESQKMYKQYDQVVSEMIRQSSAPTAKVVELQRYTLDTLGPLMLAAQGVKKGTAMKDIDPKKIEDSAKQYGAFLEKAALFSQGTGSAGFRVAAGIEGLVTRGKIDTTIDFFTDNIMLMKNLEAAGFMGRGRGTSKLMNATDAQRFAAMMEAFNKSMSGESTAAMAKSLTGSLQGLQDTIFNPSVGILGMSVTYSKEEQAKANKAITRIQNERIKNYKAELLTVKKGSKREEELQNNIKQAEVTRDKLVKENEINTPFKAFSYAFSNLIRGLTNALNAIGPVWTSLSIALIDVTNRIFGPLTETLENVASDMRGGKYTQAEGFGRIVGEIFKAVGEMMADVARMISDPKSGLGKAQSEFMKGFMDAFKEPGSLEKAKKGLTDGINALISKLFTVLTSIITSEAMRPIVIPFLALMFGPPLISAVIAGATPLIITAIGKIAMGLVGRVLPKAPARKVPPVPKAGSFVPGTLVPPNATPRPKALPGKPSTGGFLAQQGDVAAKIGSGLPGVSKAAKLAGGAKMKGIGLIASSMIAMSTHAPKLDKAGKAVTNLGKRIPLLSVAFAGLDFATQKAEGKSNLQAGASAGGGLAGGLAGAAIGQALIPIPGVGAVAGGAIGSFIGSWLGEKLAGIGPALSGAMSQLGTWFNDIKTKITSFNIGKALGAAWAGLQNTGDQIGIWFSSLPGKINNWWLGTKQAVSKWLTDMGVGIRDVAGKIARFLSNPSTWAQLITGAISGIKNAVGSAVNGLGNWFNGLKAGFQVGYNETRQTTTTPSKPQAKGGATPNPIFGQWRAYGHSGTTSLGNAINAEMRNKPAGSHLVIANSSETVIPAAGGYGDGMKGIIDAIWRSTADSTSVMVKGFTELMKATATGDQKIASVTASTGAQTKAAIDRSIAVQTSDTAKMMAAIKAASAFGGFGGGGGDMALGGGYGGKGSAIAGALGTFIKQTGGAPGSIHEHPQHGGVKGRHAPGSYHYSGRAIDIGAYAYEQGGVIARIKQFNAKHGVKPVEFLHAGNDRNHQDHVHVAYAHGLNNPRLFTSAKAAAAYEGMMAPANARVQTITANSSEKLGGNTTVNQNITISGAQDPRQLAEMVFNYAAQAAQHINNSSFA